MPVPDEKLERKIDRGSKERTRSQAFAPIANSKASVLVLGSMPSQQSLVKQQYYGHPRNAFWPISCALFGAIEPDDSAFFTLPDALQAYETRCQLLLQHGVAVWDVLESCYRPGSLDSAIDNSSIIVNDFNAFFARHPAIRRVIFNGGKAEQLYRRHALPLLDEAWQQIPYTRLPSTSPAMAALKPAEKLRQWRQVLMKETA